MLTTMLRHHENIAGGEAALRYTFKPSLLGAMWEFELTPEALLWRAGRRTGRWLYQDIAQVRLSYRPQSMQAQRYRADIRHQDGTRIALLSVTWRGMLALTTQSEDYRAFVLELHRRLAAAKGKTEFVSGLARPFYGLGLGMLVLIGIVMALLCLRAIVEGAFAGAAFVAAFMALGGWQMGGFMWRNRPGQYAPEHVPGKLLPG